MTLTHISVTKLFGELDHEIPVHWQAGLTLLRGPNGSGKTSVLKLIDNLFNKRFGRLRRIPVQGLDIHFATNEHLKVTWVDRDPGRKEKLKLNRLNRITYLEFDLWGDGHPPMHWEYSIDREMNLPASMVEDLVPGLTRVGGQRWRDDRTGHVLDLEDIVELYSDRIPFVEGRQVSPLPDWLEEILDDNPVYFIETQRLVLPAPPTAARRRELAGSSAVAFYGRDLASRISNTLADYAERSQALDSTFPNRLLSNQRKGKNLPDVDEIQIRYNAQSEKRKEYEKIGLIDAGEEFLPLESLDASSMRVLDMYLDDIDEKLDRLNSFAQRLQLFLDIVNAKLRRVYLEANRDSGLVAKTRKGRQEIDLDSLSSGEQQEIVIAYGLLFREDRGTLVLIDEPEISLHVTWQLDFISDLLKIAKVANLDFIAATHSPQIINDRWDLSVLLSDGLPGE